ncbi:hypothetical protein AgCh_035263 [Apium graveolens]
MKGTADEFEVIYFPNNKDENCERVADVPWRVSCAAKKLPGCSAFLSFYGNSPQYDDEKFPFNADFVEAGAFKISFSNFCWGYWDTLYQGQARCGLFAAAIAGDINAIAELEKETDQVFENGTILHYESKHGIAGHVHFIASKFANKLLFKLNNDRETALHVVVRNGHARVVEILLNEARILVSSPAYDAPYDSIWSVDDFVSKPNYCINTALHLAVINDNMAIVRLLVEANPQTMIHSVPNNYGETPFYLAAKWGYINIAKMICAAWPDLELNGPNAFTVLHAAVSGLLKVYMMFAYGNLHVQVELAGGIGQEVMLDGDALPKQSLALLILF